jgi:adenine-specific DNA-methyltransferase
MIEVHFNKLYSSFPEIDENGRKAFDSFEYNNSTVILREVDGNVETDLSTYTEETKCAKFIKRWAYASQNIKDIFQQNRVYLKLGNVPRFKKFKTEYEGKALRSIYYDEFSTQQGTDSLRSLFDNYSFVEYPKPVDLIRHLANGATQQNAIILDFFSGSATTAHAVMQLNAQDGGNRKFIMVQLPEQTDESSEAYKAGYKTIAEIGKERIRRAGKKISLNLDSKGLEDSHDLFNSSNQGNQENQKNHGSDSLDIGFRVYKTDTTNMKDIFYHPAELQQTTLGSLTSNIKEDRTPEDLLTQVLLDLGLELSLPIETKKIHGNTVFIVQTNALVACFDNDINFKIMDEIADLQPLKVVFKDASFKDDKDRINVEERFKRLSPETRITVL